MIASIDWRTLPAAAENRFFLDYVSGTGSAAGFYAHPLSDYGAALAARRTYPYPRLEVTERLARYNARLGAGEKALANIAALADRDTFCVVGGQQVGLLGGPAYTAYKIVSTIRLAAHLAEALGVNVIPIFWLATEDHDFNEINHIHYIQSDGEVGRVRFTWENEGHPITDLPAGEEARRAVDDYFRSLPPSPHLTEIVERFFPQTGEDYCTWHARIWSRLFSAHGLVMAEPVALRPAASSFFRLALEQHVQIRHRLREVAFRLSDAGYVSALPADAAGQVFTFDEGGRRVRVTAPEERLRGSLDPERYSTDAALRPLFADAMLPVLASVLGPGEIRYQAMLQPLYDLFGVPQPVPFPRKSYTIVSRDEAERIGRYRMSAADILAGELNPDDVLRGLVAHADLELFASARLGVEAALSPLRPYLEEIDPNLGITWTQSLNGALRGVDKLEERGIKAMLSKSGLSKGEVQALRNALLPRGRLQERGLPLTHFLNRHGFGFIDEIFGAGDLDDYSHHILTLEETDG